MKRMLSLLIALAMLMSVCSFAVAESIEAPEPKAVARPATVGLCQSRAQ